MTIRYGIIGSGMMGREHIANIALLDGATVTAICEPDDRQRQLSVHAAEHPESGPLVHPATVSAWIEEGLIPLSESDLLRGRVKTDHLVTSIDTVPIEHEDESEASSDYPADFLIHFTDSDGAESNLRVEAVLIATGSQCDIEFMFPLPCPYLHRIESTSPHDAAWLIGGRRQIVEIYSQLAGRQDLDLYRPPRV